MNKKNKNKKGRVPNPTPLQDEKPSDTVENVEKSESKSQVLPEISTTMEVTGNPSDKTVCVEEKIENVKQERVPEILSEVITPNVEKKDEETPKKPKRNRGKKKKDKEDFDENTEGKPSEFEVIEQVQENKPDVPIQSESKSEEVTMVTPSARKKKNKKQNVEEKPESSALITQEQILLTESIENKLGLASTQHAVDKTESAEETKSSKKKNKKKKRNDSEMSEKEELTCTSAFQQILDTVEQNTEIKTEQIVPVLESNEPIIDIPELTPEKNAEHMLDTMVSVVNETPIPLKDNEGIKESSLDENKSKRKNKKDKSNTIKSEESSKPYKSTENLIPTSEAIDTPITEEDSIGIRKIEESIKPKAKIAKPVEKKRKGKQEYKSETMLQDNTETEIKEETTFEPSKVIEQIELSTTDSIKTTLIEQGIPQLPIESSHILPENIQQDTGVGDSQKFEEFKCIGKKKKSKTKPQKFIERCQEVEEKRMEEVAKTGVVDESKLLSDMSAVGLEDKKEDLASEEFTKPLVITPELKDATQPRHELSDKPILLDIILESKGTILSKPEDKPVKSLLVSESTTEEILLPKIDETKNTNTEDKLKVDTKTSKKRKKSPKPQKIGEIMTDLNTPMAPKEAIPNQERSDKSSEPAEVSNLSKIEVIEISSIKAEESEGSICDAIPDVVYPRSSSQQLPDDNNNSTYIREVFPIEVMHSPLLTPEVIKSDVIIKQTPSTKIKRKDEKTDLKSKMMEVNQDMEGLRLSIERSLAELTAMERSEKEEEKQYETKKTEGSIKDTSLKDIDIGESFIDEPLERVIMAAAIGDKSKIMTLSEEQNIQSSKIDSKITKEVPILETPPPLTDQPKECSLLMSTIEEKKDCGIPTALPVEIKKCEISEEKQGSKSLPKVGEGNEKLETSKEADEEKKNVEEFKDKGKKKKKGPKTPFTNIASHGIGNPSEERTKVVDNQEKINKEQLVCETLNPTATLPEDKTIDISPPEKTIEIKLKEKDIEHTDIPPITPVKRVNKGKDKKKKGKQETTGTTTATQSTSSSSQSQNIQETKKEEKSDGKNENKTENKENKEKGKQQASNVDNAQNDFVADVDFEPIEHFEDALTSSADDLNKTFEIIVKESQEQSNPKINIIAPDEEKSPVSPPKNLLGHPDIPVPSSKRDYKKEKDKVPNEITATVNIHDSVEIEKKQSKNTQTISKMKDLNKLNDNEDYVYKYNFRKVFLQSACHVCKKDLRGVRVACNYCNLLFYCSTKHKDEDWTQHQALCFALSTIVHLKDQKHIYGDAKNITGHDYRLIRMQMIVSCEKVLKRRLVPWEQEALLYPRICAHIPCREWRQSRLSDCQGCGQISYCLDNPDHLPKSHARWCKSYSLYQKLVCYQQTHGRLEPKLPTKVMEGQYQIPDKINEVLAAMYEEKIDMSDIQYAALTQLATAPLTAAYSHQVYRNKCGSTNGVNKKSSFTIHVVGAELQFEADALNKWEVFFLHLRPDLQELRVVLVNYNLNPSNLPLELLGKIKLCDNCRQKKRRVVFSFQDKKTYTDYKASEDFIHPDLVCAFNPSIQRSSVYNGKDPWPATTNTILKLKIPLLITAYTMTELQKDCIRIKECSESGYNFTVEPRCNNFASVRPDRNFISDDEMPLLFKNYCFVILCG